MKALGPIIVMHDTYNKCGQPTCLENNCGLPMRSADAYPWGPD